MLKGYVILINPKGIVPNEAIESTLASQGDWLRFSATSYLVVSTLSSAELHRLVRALLLPTADVMVLASNFAEYSGWVSQIAVAWVNKYNQLFQTDIVHLPQAGKGTL